MPPLNSRAVPENLESYAGQLLAESAFFSALAAPRVLGEAIVRDRTADTGRLIEAARLVFWEHVTFWDDIDYATLGTENELAS
jgi:hypothetical protein